MVNVGDDGGDLDGGVDGFELASSSNSLGEILAYVVFVEEKLALEVGEFDKVAVDDTERADAGAGEEFGDDRAESPATDERDRALGEPTLAIEPDRRIDRLTAVAGVRIGWMWVSGVDHTKYTRMV